MKHFPQRLIESCESHKERLAMQVVGDDSETYTFGEMIKQVRSVAYRLQTENIEHGDRVILIGENHPCWEIAYLATLYRGAVCVPVDPHGEIDTLTNFFENSEAKMAFLSPELKGKFIQIEERLGRKIPAVVWRDEESSNGFQPFEDWTSTEYPKEFETQIPEIDLNDNAVLVYTSGTTGKPKGVPLSHGNIVAELEAIDKVIVIDHTEKVLSLLPLFHAYLQIVNLWLATTKGAQVFYLKELSPDELSKAMKVSKMTILASVPRLWYLFHKKIFDTVAAKPKPVLILFKAMLRTNGFLRDNFNINLGKKFFSQVHESFGGELRLAISAGSRFDENVAIDFHRLGFTIIQGYGLSETSGAATATYVDDNRVGSVGKPMYGTEVKIDDPDKDGVGEVLIRGGIVFAGYYKNPEATAEAFTADGWFKSGDLGKFDKDGHLYIVGRAKDVVVLPSGKNVHPEDLEVHYLKSPLVEEMAIIGIEDTSEGRAGAEKLVAIVVPDFEYLKSAKIANSREAIRYSLDNLGREIPEYQRVREYIIRAEPLPRTATRKIKRFELKKEVETGVISAGEGKSEKAWTLTEDDKKVIESKIGRAVTAVIEKNAKDASIIHPQMNLEIDLGLDSLSRAEVFAALEQAFATEFEGEEAAEALKVGDVVELVKKHAGEIDESQEISTDLNWSKIIREKAEDVPEVQYVIRDRWFFPAVAYTVYKLFKLFNLVFMRLEVSGEDVFDELKRPFLICPNHQSFFDPFIITANYPFRIYKNIFHVGAAMYFQNWFTEMLGRWLNVVPIDPDTELMKAMKAGAIGLRYGKVLNIYPEGERAFDGKLSEFKKGAAILATELELPIVPVAIDGVYKVWSRRSWMIRPAKVKVRYGKPFFPKDVLAAQPDLSDEQKYEAVTAHLKSEIAKMIDEMRR
ncbi:MAG: AMP-binding protein [Pyrinomonadaceae bacterium]|nr:AMP-binding protein [Pyrinomonadaceae bacterium]